MSPIHKHAMFDLWDECLIARIMKAPPFLCSKYQPTWAPGRNCIAMNHTDEVLPVEPRETRLEDLQASLKKLERRDWWLWAVAILVMLLLTLAVVSLSFPGLVKTEDPFFQYSLNQAVRGLIGLVLLFNAYSIYQQAQIKKLRRQFSEQMQVIGKLKGGIL